MNCFILYLVGKQISIEERLTILMLMTVQPLLRQVLVSASKLLDIVNLFTVLVGLDIVKSNEKPIVSLLLSLSQKPDGTIQRILCLPNVENAVYSVVFHPMVANFIQTHGNKFITHVVQTFKNTDFDLILRRVSAVTDKDVLEVEQETNGNFHDEEVD